MTQLQNKVATRWKSINVMLKNYVKKKKVMLELFCHMSKNGRSAGIKDSSNEMQLKQTEKFLVTSLDPLKTAAERLSASQQLR